MQERLNFSMEKSTKIAEGNTAEIYEYESGKILKLFKDGYGKSAVEKEWKKACEIQKFLKNIPNVYEIIQVQKRYGIIYEKIDGCTLLKPLAGKPWKAREIGKQMAQIHKQIHQQNLDKHLNQAIINKVEDKLKNDFLHSTKLTEKEKNEMMKLLVELPAGNCLCHMDFHPGNIMIANQEIKVIDWNDAVMGDPLCDVARTMLLIKNSAQNESQIGKKLFVYFFCRQLLIGYRKEYLKTKNYSASELKKWEIILSAARLSEGISENEKTVLKRTVINYIKSQKAKR